MKATNESTQRRIEKIQSGNAILTDIELMDGTLIQFIDGYAIVHANGFTMRTYVGRNPDISIETDIWGCTYIAIEYNHIVLKPSEIKIIDIEEIEE